MVQTSDKSSRKVNDKTRSSIEFHESKIPQKEQEYTGWYYCSERKAYYRWDEFINYKC